MVQHISDAYQRPHTAMVTGYRWLIVIGVLMVLLIDPLFCHTSCQSLATSSPVASVHMGAGEMSQFLCFWQTDSPQTPEQPSDHNPLTHHSHAATVIMVSVLVLVAMRLAFTIPIITPPPITPDALPLRPPIPQTA